MEPHRSSRRSWPVAKFASVTPRELVRFPGYTGFGPASAALEEGASRPVSRVLSGGKALRDGHSSGTRVAHAPRATNPGGVAWKRAWRRKLPRTPGHPYLVLLPVGFTVPLLLPVARCALTAPFHPCLMAEATIGGLISVALSLGSPPAAVSRHRVSMEPGLSSAGVASQQIPPPGSGRLACWHLE